MPTILKYLLYGYLALAAVLGLFAIATLPWDDHIAMSFIIFIALLVIFSVASRKRY